MRWAERRTFGTAIAGIYSDPRALHAPLTTRERAPAGRASGRRVTSPPRRSQHFGVSQSGNSAVLLAAHPQSPVRRLRPAAVEDVPLEAKQGAFAHGSRSPRGAVPPSVKTCQRPFFRYAWYGAGSGALARRTPGALLEPRLGGASRWAWIAAAGKSRRGAAASDLYVVANSEGLNSGNGFQALLRAATAMDSWHPPSRKLGRFATAAPGCRSGLWSLFRAGCATKRVHVAARRRPTRPALGDQVVRRQAGPGKRGPR